MARTATKKVVKHPHSHRETWRGEKIADDFGEIVAQRRHDMQLSQTQVAARMTDADAKHPVTANTVSAFELGYRVHFPRPYMLFQWAVALELSYEEMFEASYGSDPND